MPSVFIEIYFYGNQIDKILLLNCKSQLGMLEITPFFVPGVIRFPSRPPHDLQLAEGRFMKSFDLRRGPAPFDPKATWLVVSTSEKLIKLKPIFISISFPHGRMRAYVTRVKFV